MSFEYSEDNLIENATQDALQQLGWEVADAWTKFMNIQVLDYIIFSSNGFYSFADEGIL